MKQNLYSDVFALVLLKKMTHEALFRLLISLDQLSKKK